MSAVTRRRLVTSIRSDSSAPRRGRHPQAAALTAVVEAVTADTTARRYALSRDDQARTHAPLPAPMTDLEAARDGSAGHKKRPAPRGTGLHDYPSENSMLSMTGS